MKIVLLANYLPDQQESMQRYTAMLERLLLAAGKKVEVIRPSAFFGSLKPSAHGLGKWLGYLDKFVLFRWHLSRYLRTQRALGEKVLIHICDHSNAMYVPWINGPSLVTCHDLLAIKSALGLVPQNQTGRSGRILQRWILRGLKRASFVVCDSAASRDDLISLAPHLQNRSEVIDLPLSYPFTPLPPEQVTHHLKALDEPRLFASEGNPVPYLFHVGGNQWYKNREGVLEVFALLKQGGAWPQLKLVMAGKAPTSAMEQFVRERNLQEDVIFPPSVSDVQLNALYSGAQALLYPSLQEGYGWPILEAQASGSLVITSDLAPMNVIGGPAAFYGNPADPSTFVARLLEILRMNASEISARRTVAVLHTASNTPDGFIQKMDALYTHLFIQP